MAQQFHEINLHDANFPLLSEQQTRTIIGSSARDTPVGENKPGISYCHNVMPSPYGLDSVGFTSVVTSAPLPVGVTFDTVKTIYGDEQSKLYLGWDTNGNVYAILPGANFWTALPDTVPSTTDANFDMESVTVGVVDGVSYIYYSKKGAFNFQESSNTLVAVTLTGINIGNTLGVVASSGYLIAYTTLAIAWSSTLDPTDFIPSQVTGAGGGNVAGTAGSILFCTSSTIGILVYTESNIINASYTGNVQFPFKFREIQDSKGGISLDRTALDANGLSQFVYSKAGMQAITSQRAEVVVPEVTNFLAGSRIEDYNTDTKLYEITNLSPPQTLLKKVRYIASRYLIISYGVETFTHALVYDLGLKRLGKIKIEHVDCFEYIGDQKEISRESMAFVLSTGEIKTLDFSVNSENSSGVLILGKLQFVRSRLISLLGVEFENVEEDSTFDCFSQVSLDGKSFVTVEGTLDLVDPDLKVYNFRAEGKNHALVLIGKFNMTTAQVRYSVSSRR